MAETSNKQIHFHEIPDVILSNTFSLISDARTRNAVSLVCLKWHSLERSTRTSLTLRGNIRDLFLLPTCFRNVTHLDLSFLSPWGHPFFESSPDPPLLAQRLRIAFPSVESLTMYSRSPTIIRLLAPQWPNLLHVKILRWHPRLDVPLGEDFLPLFEHCLSLSSLDLANFYCWTEDLPLALQSQPSLASSLSHLNILRHSFSEGFKSHELLSITSACPNLQKFLATCTFDHRFIGFVGDETLFSIVTNCPRLSVLHLDDTRVEAKDDEGFTLEDARITQTTLINVFTKLPLLEDLVLDVCHNVRESWKSLEQLKSNCPKLKSLKLGNFHGICRDDGTFLFQELESLSIKNSADLTDSKLCAISLGCPNLSKFEVEGCNKITVTSLTNLVRVLQKTLIDIRVCNCKNFDTISLIRALEPIQDRIKGLHFDCVWMNTRKLETETETETKKTSKYNNAKENQNFVNPKIWGKLEFLSLWISVGDLLNPLPFVGLNDCPVLEEIIIKIEGDCRHRPRSSTAALGLSSLGNYPNLTRMKLDCSGAIGYAWTAPLGHADLSLWERFFLRGISDLKLEELDYWPPQDVDVNQRSLSLPAAGLLTQCRSLRKLFIHGTANEHFMMFLVGIPGLRDVQLREDYYPAPEGETSTEMRVVSCSRFEDALNRRRILD